MSVVPRTLILYSTAACHLCEIAHTVIQPYLDELSITLEEVDISESDPLIEKYGIRIPVVKFEGKGEELGWPFTAEEFLVFAGS